MAAKKTRRKRGQPVIQEALAEQYGVKLEPAKPEDRYLSPNDIGKILNITGEAVKQWIYHRRLPAVKLANGYWKVRVVDFETYLKSRNDIGRRRVLLVGSQLESLSKVVEGLGHTPVVAQNRIDGILKIQDQQPALVVISLDQDGLQGDAWPVVEELRKEKATRNIPVLVIAGGDTSSTNDLEELKISGVQAFLKHPINSVTLGVEINRLLNRM